jgi:hypothetical protein
MSFVILTEVTDAAHAALTLDRDDVRTYPFSDAIHSLEGLASALDKFTVPVNVDKEAVTETLKDLRPTLNFIEVARAEALDLMNENAQIDAKIARQRREESERYKALSLENNN